MSMRRTYELSPSGMLTPPSPAAPQRMRRSTPVRIASFNPPVHELDMDELDRELEHISQSSTMSLQEEIEAELDAELEEVLRSPGARAAWEGSPQETAVKPFPVSSNGWMSSTRSSSKSSRSTKSPVRDRVRVYPDPIGTPRRQRSDSPSPSSTSASSPSSTSSLDPLTPLNTHTTFHPTLKPRRSSTTAHPSAAFWQHCTSQQLDALQDHIALWIGQGMGLVQLDWRRPTTTTTTTGADERERESTTRACKVLLEQWEALRAYRVYRSGCTAEQLLDELSI